MAIKKLKTIEKLSKKMREISRKIHKVYNKKEIGGTKKKKRKTMDQKYISTYSKSKETK